MQWLSIRTDGARALDAAPHAPADGEFFWCDCVHEHAREWVEPVARLTGATVFDVHLLDAENLGHPSYFDSTRDYEMIVFRGLAPRPAEPGAAEPVRVRTRPTAFFVFPRCLVTVRAADSQGVPATRERLLAAAGARQRLPSGPEDLMLRLLNGQVDRYLELRQPLTEQLERWQRLLLDPRRPFRDWFALLEARGELRKLERLCEEQLDAIQEWRDERLERVGPHEPQRLGTLTDPLLVRANDLVEHVHRVLQHARRMEASAESAVQLHFASTAHRTNEIVRTLTTITAIFMPLTLITGIFGMNFETIPGLHSPLGFWITIGAMALISVALLAYFRARRYLASEPAVRARRRRAAPVSGAAPDAPGASGRSPSPDTPEGRRPA